MIIQPHDAGWIEVVCGSMFSGKTEELIRRLRRALIAQQHVQIFKPSIDDRYERTSICSHEGRTLEATIVANVAEIETRLLDDVRVVGIDEAQFFDASLVPLCNRLASAGVRVVVAGLDLDYLGRPFGPIPALMATAEFVTKTMAVCVLCGAPASRSHRLRAQAGQVLVGAADSYQPLCRRCFDRERETADQLAAQGTLGL